MIEITESPDGATITLAANVNTFKSTLNGFEQHSILPGSRWAASFSWTGRKGADARRLRAQLSGLLGPVGVFKIRIPEADNLGTALGLGVVVAAVSGDSQLTSSGWTPSQAELLKSGDWIEFNQQAFQVTEDCASDVAGLATIKVAPPIRRTTVAGSVINATNPSFYMRMTDNAGAQAALSPAWGGPIYALAIDAMEID